jgi:hypothetical protein
MRHIAVAWADPGKSVSIPDHIVLTRRFDLQPSRVISASRLLPARVAPSESCPFSALSGNARWLCGQSPHRCVGQSNPANVRDGHSSNSVVRDLRTDHQPAFHFAVRSLVSGPIGVESSKPGKLARRHLDKIRQNVAPMNFERVSRLLWPSCNIVRCQPVLSIWRAKGLAARLCGLVSEFF